MKLERSNAILGDEAQILALKKELAEWEDTADRIVTLYAKVCSEESAAPEFIQADESDRHQGKLIKEAP